MVGYKAEEAGIGQLEARERKLKPIQLCHRCSSIVKKTLGDRWHECVCGASCQRDVNSTLEAPPLCLDEMEEGAALRPSGAEGCWIWKGIVENRSIREVVQLWTDGTSARSQEVREPKKLW
ncbi:transposase [Methylacidiphilum fumariolicum]|nr:transposase [Candidatus Methylacidiphilum fumarolicum]